LLRLLATIHFKLHQDMEYPVLDHHVNSHEF